MIISSKQYYYLILLYFITLLFFLPEHFFPGDLAFWFKWVNDINNYGFSNVYYHEVNYLPLLLYNLLLFDALFPDIERFYTFIKYIKTIPLLFDFAGALAILLFKEFRDKKYLTFLALFNISYLYNTLVWGQFDAIHSALLIFSMIFLVKNKPFPGVIFYLLSLNAKLQGITFIPIFLLLLLPQFSTWKNWLFKTFFAVVILQAILFLPFLNPQKLSQIIEVITSSVGYFPIVSLNATNFWDLVLWGYNPYYVSNEETLWIFTYKTYGFILFLFAGALALLPLALMLLNKIIKKNFDWKPQHRSLIFLTYSIVALIFFYFNTEMHERYAHPAYLGFFLYGCFSGNWWFFGAFCFANLLTLERVNQYLNFPHYGIVIFDGRFIAGIFTLLLIASYYSLYKSYPLRSSLVALKVR